MPSIPETLMTSIRKGAISYLPKEMLSELDTLLNELLDARAQGQPPWRLLFDKLGKYFDESSVKTGKKRTWRSGPIFSRTYQIGQRNSGKVAA